MPIPLAVGRLNKAGLNRVTRRIAPWAPGLGVVAHRGQRSGRAYETPVKVFPTADGRSGRLSWSVAALLRLAGLPGPRGCGERDARADRQRHGKL